MSYIKHISRKRTKKLKWRTNDKCKVYCQVCKMSEPHYSRWRNPDPTVRKTRWTCKNDGIILTKEQILSLKNNKKKITIGNKVYTDEFNICSIQRCIRRFGVDGECGCYLKRYWNSWSYNIHKKNRKAHRNYIPNIKKNKKKNSLYEENENCPICCENMKGRIVKKVACCKKAMCVGCFYELKDHMSTSDPFDPWNCLGKNFLKCPMCRSNIYESPRTSRLGWSLCAR